MHVQGSVVQFRPVAVSTVAVAVSCSNVYFKSFYYISCLFAWNSVLSELGGSQRKNLLCRAHTQSTPLPPSPKILPPPPTTLEKTTKQQDLKKHTPPKKKKKKKKTMQKLNENLRKHKLSGRGHCRFCCIIMVIYAAQILEQLQAPLLLATVSVMLIV